MIHRRFISAILATLMITGQFAWTATAAAEDPAASSPASPAATVVATPTPTATATPVPSPDAAVVAAPTPTPTPTVAPTATPTATPAATPETPVLATATVKPEAEVTGANGCGGVAPNWVFDTVSRTWVAADKSSFSCDKASGYYLSPKYYYDKRIGWYEIIPDSAIKPDYMITAPNVVHTILGDLVVGSADYQVAKALGLLDGGGTTGILGANTGGGNASLASSQPAGGNQSWFDLTNLVNVVNILQSNATSGNAAANSNTTVGNVGTGAASVVANLINLLASAWSWSNGNLSFFMQNILAPMTGDINLNPTVVTNGGGGALGNVALNGTGANSTNNVDINNPTTLNVNAKSTGSITNNVDVNAVSGAATAGKNTQVGNVTTGNAMAQVNIINLINSFITSGSSFFGILNIIGSLNGDILFPAGFLNGLVPASIAPVNTTAAISGTGAGSSNQLGVNNSASATVNNSSVNSVNNNVLTTAGSGAANVGSNTSAGDVSTGAATTNQGLFNMANSSIFGDNAVLVMVNVLGHWVGKIMTLPGTGNSQAALLTGNATAGPQTGLAIIGTGADSTNKANVDNSVKATVNQQTEGTITNNVRVNAQSGDATATANTQLGDVATGSAKAGSSVANLFNTVLNVKHWFGVLVINVFGDWLGDVNHDSAAGGFSTEAGGNNSNIAGGGPAAAGSTAATGGGAVSGPVSHDIAGLVTGGINSSTTPVISAISGTTGAKVLTAASQTLPVGIKAATQSRDMSLLFMISILVFLSAGALLAIEKKLKR